MAISRSGPHSPASFEPGEPSKGNPMIGAYIMLGIVTVLWLAFGATLLLDSGRLDVAWTNFRDRSLIVQAIGAFLLLPWVAGLWVWEQGWPILIRATLLIGLAVATVGMFVPRR